MTEEAWKNDWRNRGQMAYLGHQPLFLRRYHARSERWRHEHCEFCWATIDEEGTENLHEGYATDDNDDWVCPQCFEDLKDIFGWTAVDQR